MSALTRRSVLTAALVASSSAVAACLGKANQTAPSPSGDGTAVSSSTAPIRLNPVSGFKDTPEWVSTSVPELAGWVPDPGACGIWYDEHAWVIVTRKGKSRALAIDTKAKKAVLSPDLPAAVRHLETGTAGSPWCAITTPSKALVLRLTDGRLVTLAVRGGSITVTQMPKSPAVNESNSPVWKGESIVVVQKNTTYKATGDAGDAGNKLLPSYYLDPAAKKWVAMLPKHNGTIVGVTTHSGSTPVPVELAGEDLWVGSQSFKTGFSRAQGVASAAGPLPFTGFVWAANGVLLMTVRAAEGGSVFVRYDKDGKPIEGEQGIGNTWKPKTGEAVLMPGGNVYAPSSGMLMGGIYLPQGSYDWELLNATVAPGGTLYANADPSPQSGALPTSGSYVSTTGELNANQHTDKNAPVIVTPDGAGAFVAGAAWVVAAKS